VSRFILIKIVLAIQIPFLYNRRMKEIKLAFIEDIVIEGINHEDAPDYVDAYIESAKYDDPDTPDGEVRDLTDDELDSLPSDFVHAQVMYWIH